MQDGGGHSFPVAQVQSAGQQDPAYHAQNTINGESSLPHLLPYPAQAYTAHVQPPFDMHPNSYSRTQSANEPQPAIEAGPSNLSLSVPSKGSSGGKTFQCTGFEGCNMSFSRNEHLARHVRKHTGEKPFACRCGKKFTRLDNLRQHASTIHADEPEANEELFTRLAANLPRSGRVTRRKPAQAKRMSHEAIGEPESSTSVMPVASQQTSYLPAHHSQPETFLPPLTIQRPQLFPEIAAHTSTSATMLHSASSDGVVSQPLPSPSFRFPLAPNSQTGASFQNIDHHASSSYEQRSHSTFPSIRQDPPTCAREQQFQPQYPIHPSHAFDYGRDGSSFRVTQSSTFIPSRAQYPSSIDLTPAGDYSSVTVTAGGSPGLPSADRVHSTFSTKPILPSLSSLIAGAPAPYPIAISARQNGQNMGMNADHGQNANSHRLDSTLLVAAEMAIHDTQQDHTMSSTHSLDSRSSSFSMSSANTSGRHTNATSPGLYSPCPTA